MDLKYEKYADFVRTITSKIPVLHTQQIVLAMTKYFPGCSEGFCLYVLQEMQNDNRLLLSNNGWAMTSHMYKMITNDRWLMGIDLHNDAHMPDVLTVYDSEEHKQIVETGTVDDLLGKLPNGRTKKKQIDAMWVASYLMPDSSNFIVNCSPWTMVFTHEDDESGLLIEVMRLPAKGFSTNCEMLLDMNAPADETARKFIQRFALVDDERFIADVPKIGFKWVAVMDQTCDHGFRLMETRKLEHRWDDIRNVK